MCLLRSAAPRSALLNRDSLQQTATAIAGRCVSAAPCRAMLHSAAFRHVLHRHATPCPLPRTLSNARRVEQCIATPCLTAPCRASSCKLPRTRRCAACLLHLTPTRMATQSRSRLPHPRTDAVCLQRHAEQRKAAPSSARTLIARLPPTVARARCVWQALEGFA